MKIDPEHTWGHTIPFGEEYYQNAVKLLRNIRDDATIMAEVAAKAADAIRAGNKVYANITTGHMPTYELVNDREGNPAQFEFTGADTCTPEQFAAMRAGDALLTNHVSEAVRDARDAGVYVVVFTTPATSITEIRLPARLCQTSTIGCQKMWHRASLSRIYHGTKG